DRERARVELVGEPLLPLAGEVPAGHALLRLHPEVRGGHVDRELAVPALHAGELEIDLDPHPALLSVLGTAVIGAHPAADAVAVAEVGCPVLEVDVEIELQDGALLGAADLEPGGRQAGALGRAAAEVAVRIVRPVGDLVAHVVDRKSTRLNSSHVKISYAVF